MMRKSLMSLSLCLGILPFAALADTSRIVQAILGKTLESQHVKQAHIYADGTLDGVFNGIAYAGTWTMEEGRYCRELTRGLVSERACLDLLPVTDQNGDLVAVLFKAPGLSTRFDIR